MRSKKLLSLFILMVLLISPMTAIIYGDEPEVDPDPKEEDLLETEGEEMVTPRFYEELHSFLMGEEGVDYLEGLIEDAGEDVSPSIKNNAKHMRQAFERAEQFKEDGKDNAATQQLHNSFVHYRNALRKLLQEYPELDEFEDVEVEIEVEEVDEEEVEEHKVKLMIQYEENLANRVQEMTETMNQIMDQLGEEDRLRMFSVIENTLRKLERIRERLEQGMVDEAVDIAEEAEEALEMAFSRMVNQQFASLLRTMYRLDAMIQRMEEIKNLHAEKGLDVGDELLLIGQLRNAMEEAKSDMELGDLNGAEGILGQASENAKGKGKGKNK
jgi:ketosteroid isomerase-like protein